MFPGHCFCRLGMSVIYALPGFICCISLFPPVLSQHHGSPSTACTLPVTPVPSQRAVTNQVSQMLGAAHTEITRAQAIPKEKQGAAVSETRTEPGFLPSRRLHSSSCDFQGQLLWVS